MLYVHVHVFFQKVSLPSDLNIHKLKLSCPRSGPLQSLPSDDVFYDTTDSMTVGPDSDSDGGVATDRRPRYCTYMYTIVRNPLSLSLPLSLPLSLSLVILFLFRCLLNKTLPSQTPPPLGTSCRYGNTRRLP